MPIDEWVKERNQARGQAADALRYQAQVEAATAKTVPIIEQVFGGDSAQVIARRAAEIAGQRYQAQAPGPRVSQRSTAAPAPAPVAQPDPSRSSSYWESAMASKGYPMPQTQTPAARVLARYRQIVADTLPYAFSKNPADLTRATALRAGGVDVTPGPDTPEAQRLAYIASQRATKGLTLGAVPATEQPRNGLESVVGGAAEMAGSLPVWEGAFGLAAPVATAATPVGEAVGSAAARLAARLGAREGVQQGTRALTGFLTREAARGAAAGAAATAPTLLTEPAKTPLEAAKRVGGAALGTAAFSAAMPLVGEAVSRFGLKPISRIIGDRRRTFAATSDAIPVDLNVDLGAEGYRFFAGKNNQPGLWVKQDPTTGLHYAVQVERRVSPEGNAQTWMQMFQEVPKGVMRTAPKTAETGQVIDVTPEAPRKPAAATVQPEPAPVVEPAALPAPVRVEAPNPSPVMPAETPAPAALKEPWQMTKAEYEGAAAPAPEHFAGTKYPETVYHGSGADNIEQFFTGGKDLAGNTGAKTARLGAFFSEDPTIASMAAYGFNVGGAFDTERKLTLYEARVNMKNPLEVNGLTEKQVGELDQRMPGFRASFEKAKAKGEMFGVVQFLSHVREPKPEVGNFSEWAAQHGIPEADVDRLWKENAPAFQEWRKAFDEYTASTTETAAPQVLQDMGYDGIVVNTKMDSGKNLGAKKQYIVFKPENIAISRKRPVVEHRQWVEYALKEGKPVPPEVLAEYPDLTAKAPGEPVAAAEAPAKPAEVASAPAVAPVSRKTLPTYAENVAKDSVELKFPVKPDDATILKMRETGFKWQRQDKVWFAKRTDETTAYAKALAGVETPVANATVEAAAATEPPLQPKELPPLAETAKGSAVTAETERGTKVQLHYAAVEAPDLVASHDTALRRNPDYPVELQPRDRGRIASEEQVTRIVNKLSPARLGDSPMVSDGAPVVGPDGAVESGNGRVIALKRAYELEHPNREAYKQWLVDNAQQFGLDKATVEKMKAPVLVRVRDTAVDRVKFTQEANEQAVATMSPTEKAKNDAQKLTGSLMAQFVPSETGEIDTPANRPFIREFMGRVVSDAERPELMQDDAAINQAGVLRIRNAVFAKAYGDVGTVEKLAESTDSNVRTLTNAMLIAAPRLAAVKEGIIGGKLHDLDITGDIAAAVNKLSTLRKTGGTVQDYLRQTTLLGDDLTALGKDLLDIVDRNSRSAKKLSGILLAYADAVEAAGDPRYGADLFGRAAPTKAEVLAAALRKVELGSEGQTSLLEGAAGSRQGAGASTLAIPAQQVEEATGTEGKGRGQVGGGTQSFAAATRPAKPNLEGPAPLKPMARKALVRWLGEQFNVTLAKGHFNQRAFGIYKVKPEVIRTKAWGDLQTLAHEIGHHIDKKLGLDALGHGDELLTLGQPASTKSHTKAEVRTEGIAEFFRLYLGDPATARAKAPGFYTAFETRLESEPELAKVIADAQKQFEAQFKARPADEIDAATSWVNRKAPLRERLQDLPEKFNQATNTIVDEAFDSNDSIRRVQQELSGVRGGTELPTEVNGFLHLSVMQRKIPGHTAAGLAELQKDVLGDLGKVKLTPEEATYLRDKLTPLRLRNGIKPGQSFGVPEAYLTYRDAKTAIWRADRFGYDNSELPFTREAAETYVQMADDSPFAALLKDTLERESQWYHKYLVDELKASEWLDDEAIAKIEAAHEIYTPFFRDVQKGKGRKRTGSGKTAANLPNAIMSQHGGGEPLLDPIVRRVLWLQRVVNIAQRNSVAVAIDNLSDAYDASGKLWDDVPPPMQAIEVKAGDVTISRDDELIGLEDAGFGGDPLDPSDTISFFRPKWANGKNDTIIQIRRKGKTVYRDVHDPAVFRTIATVDPVTANIGLKLLEGFAKVVKTGATITPTFSVFNLLRDTSESWRFSIHQILPGHALFEALLAAAKKDPIVARMVKDGLKQSGWLSPEKQSMQMLRDIAKGDKFSLSFRGLWNFYQEVRENPEFWTRLGEASLEDRARLRKMGYKDRAALRQKIADGTATPEEKKASEDAYLWGLYEGNRITLNWFRSGYSVKWWNSKIPFFKIPFEASYRELEFAREHPIVSLLKLTLLASTGVALAITTINNEAYRNATPYERDNYWLIPIGPGLIKVPKANGLAGVIVDMFERAAREVAAADPHAWDGFAADALSMLTPRIGNPAIDLAVGLATGQQLGSDFPIVPESEANLPAPMQYSPSTSVLARGGGALTKSSPEKWQFGIETLIPGFSTGLFMAEDWARRQAAGEKPASMRQEDYPVTGRFISRPGEGKQGYAVTVFYDEKDKADTLYAGIKKKASEASGVPWPENGSWEFTADKKGVVIRASKMGAKQRQSLQAALAAEVGKLKKDNPDDFRMVSHRSDYAKWAQKLTDLRNKRKEAEESKTLTPQQKRQAIEAYNRQATNTAEAALGKSFKGK